MLTRIGRRGLALGAAVVALTCVLLFAAVSLGARLPGLGFLSPFARGSALDYATGPGALAPLDPSYVADLLGLRFPTDVVQPKAGGGGGDGVLPVPSKTFPSSHPPVPFTNDAFDEPVIVTGVPFTTTTDPRSATREPDEPGDCSIAGGTAWYRYSSNEGGRTLIANTIGSDGGTILGVFKGSEAGDLQNVGCAKGPTGNAQFLFVLEPDTTYHFQVAWQSTRGRKLVFNLDPLGTTERVPARPRPNGQSERPVVTADGRFVAFSSDSTNLVPGANRNCRSVPGLAPEVTNQVQQYPNSIACKQAYLYDRETRRIEHLSVSSLGVPANAPGDIESISADGRYVVFTSWATNLVPEKRNADPSTWGVYVRDRLARTTSLVSVSSDEQVANESSFHAVISGNSRYVAFQSFGSNLVPGDTNGDWDTFVRDVARGTTERVSLSTAGEQGNAGSWVQSISQDGRYIVFSSDSNNLVPGDTNQVSDVFVRDRLHRTTERVSVSSAGEQGNDYSNSTHGQQISDDGRYVAFVSYAANLVPEDTNEIMDVFVRDRLLHRTIRASVSSSGVQGQETKRKGLRDRITLVPTCGISGDGRFVVFDTLAANLTPYDRNVLPDVYLHDLLTGATLLVSTTREGQNGNLHSVSGAISDDGHSVVFLSYATDLVKNDVRVNGSNIYLHHIDFGP